MSKSTAQTARKSYIIENPWQSLNRFTDARIGLGRAGSSLPTNHHLNFQLAHSQARDAVHIPLDTTSVTENLNCITGQPVWLVKSEAGDRSVYLQRPDLGRKLHPDSVTRLRRNAATLHHFDITVVVADGLSSTAIHQHAAPMVANLYSALSSAGLRCSPACVVEQGRVAVGDDIGELLGSRLLVMLIGERPGLSSPDSLGIYFTRNPKRGKTDADRNCISNIRTEGLSYEEATHKLLYLLKESDRRQLSGYQLKEESDSGSTVLHTEEKPLPNLLVEKQQRE